VGREAAIPQNADFFTPKGAGAGRQISESQNGDRILKLFWLSQVKGANLMPDETKSPQPEEEHIKNGEKPTDVEPEHVVEEEQQASPEQPEPEIPPVQPESALLTEEQPPSPPTFMDKVKRWVAYALFGLLAVALIFLAGFLTSYFVNTRPLQASLAEQAEEIAQIQTQVETLENRNTDLSTSLSNANTRISGLEGDIAGLQADLEMADMHLLLLHTVNDFNTANLALSNGDVSGAKVALLGTPKRIETLLPLIATVDSPLANNLENRFKMIQDNLESDSQTAQFDLGLLAKSLLNVETLLFAP
jgi:hypothetical protein